MTSSLESKTYSSTSLTTNTPPPRTPAQPPTPAVSSSPSKISSSLDDALRWFHNSPNLFGNPILNSTTEVHSSTGPKQNVAIQVGALRRRAHIWRWAHTVLRSDASARALRIVEEGYRLPFLPTSASPLRTHDVFLPNHIRPSHDDGPWVTRQLDLMRRAGVIRRRRPLDRGATFSPLFVVEKAGGSGRRLIVDMRSLNSELEKIPFSLAPAMLHRNRDILSKANGLFVLDFTSSFQHVEIHEDHQRHFGIAWGGEEYFMTCAPYGCSSVPEMFQTVASIFRAVAVKVGLSTTLTSPDSWEHAITVDSTMDLPGASFPAASHFPLETRQYLDDTWGPTYPTITSLSGTSLSRADTAAVTPLLIRSLAALAKCFG